MTARDTHVHIHTHNLLSADSLPNSCNSWCWARLKPGSRNSIQVSLWKTRAQTGTIICCFLRSASRELVQRQSSQDSDVCLEVRYWWQLPELQHWPPQVVLNKCYCLNMENLLCLFILLMSIFRLSHRLQIYSFGRCSFAHLRNQHRCQMVAQLLLLS